MNRRLDQMTDREFSSELRDWEDRELDRYLRDSEPEGDDEDDSEREECEP